MVWMVLVWIVPVWIVPVWIVPVPWLWVVAVWVVPVPWRWAVAMMMMMMMVRAVAVRRRGLTPCIDLVAAKREPSGNHPTAALALLHPHFPLLMAEEIEAGIAGHSDAMCVAQCRGHSDGETMN